VTTPLRCPVCGTPSRHEDTFRDISLWRCPACDHCFTDVASLDYLGEYDEAWESLHPNWFENPQTDLFAAIADRIRRDAPGSRVIDIGCGRGELLEFLRARDASLELTGLDISLRPEIEGVEIITGDVASADLGGRTWDVATSLATIEHVEDVTGFVARLHEVVVPGGLAIVMTVNDRSVLYESARLLRRLGYAVAYERLYDRFHLNHFNIRSLRTLMERGGFRTLEQLRHNIPLRSVDMPTRSPLLLAGVWGTFALGRLTGRTYEQTLVARRP